MTKVCMSSATSPDCIAEDIEFKLMEITDREEALLTALLNDPLIEGEVQNPEELGSVIRSLEDEIDQCHPNEVGTSTTSPSLTVEDYESEDMGMEEALEYCPSSVSSSSQYSPSPTRMDNFDWINDMEMDCTTISQCDIDEMGISNWYMDMVNDEIDSPVMEFGDVIRDYNFQLYYGSVHNFDEEEGYSSLWQET